ncbi:colicin I receptor precursor [mine drainage metagenome]|uniref:Colicin I receptor n=1 Tax=mine drainage metagenome TaxID=410659 RepID=A0A1J5TMF2_9ZZZZ
MRVKLFFYFLFTCIFYYSFAQQRNIDSAKRNVDSSLNEVVVTAFQSKARWKDAPVSVAVITQKDLQNISTTSLLPAINAVAGVRMEERSPGSYRLSIRGSTLRSPFGVRNIKIYWNDIPLTDGGGNTYLNLIDVNQLTGAEIIKGPSASMYGAGTGGVLLLKSSQSFLSSSTNSFNASVSGGSFNLLNEQTGFTHQQNNFTTSVQQSHLQSDGYRQQSAMRKDVVKWDASLQLKDQQLNFLIFYADLNYQTPGGLTKSQMLQDPQLARPAAGSIPGAVQQQATIYNKTLFGGLNHQYKISESFSTETSLMLNHTSFTNPAILNYENRDETNTGILTKIIYHHKINETDFQWSTGAEWLYNHSRIDDYKNKNGVADSLQLKDDVYVNQWFGFSQVQINYKRWSLNAGVSLNNQMMHYKRLTDANTNYVNTNNENVLAPRVALLYKINQHVSLYSLAAKGFSPPSLAEVHPQDRIFHSELQPEYGWNFETALKGDILNHRLQFDLALYDFELKDAIVIRNNAQGAQYFVNAGSISEKGIELWMKYNLLNQRTGFLKTLNVWGSYTYQPYYFNSYVQGTNNYAGNAVTGVPKNNFVVGLDAAAKNNFYLHIQYTQTSSLPLDDANDEFANASHLLQLKLGKHFRMHKTTVHVFAGADNLLNEVYSLGNDINAAARRFYNPASARNYFIGAALKL